jgi:lysozyme
MNNYHRVAIALLSLSATALVGNAMREGYTEKAIIPIPGDVPTKGHGTTRNADGTPVKLGDTTTPTRSLVDLLRDSTAASEGLKKCIHADLHQYEFDAYSMLAYNVGVGAVCSSSIPTKLHAGQYEAACNTISDFNGVCLDKPRRGKCKNKKIIKGLVNARAIEKSLCLQQ